MILYILLILKSANNTVYEKALSIIKANMRICKLKELYG